MVHAGHPVGVHRGFLLLRILAPVALDLDDEMQQVVVAVAVIDQHDEVGQILPRLRAVAVRHFEPEVVVLDVGDAPWDAPRPRGRTPPPSRCRESTQLTWFFGGGPLVSQRSVRDVLKRTCLVEPVGL